MPPAPSLQTVFPFVRKLGEDIDSSANVLAAFRVMSRTGIHRVRLRAPPLDVPPMKLINAEKCFRSGGGTSDFVCGDERVVAVKRRIFESFGHHRTRELLP